MFVPIFIGNSAYAADFIEDFESYELDTDLPTGWTYEYRTSYNKVPELENHSVISHSGDKAYQIQLGTVRERPSIGSQSVGSLLSPPMTADMQSFSVDILGRNLQGAGGESSAGAAVGYAILYDTDTETKSIGVRTHALKNKNVSFSIVYNGTFISPQAVLNDFDSASSQNSLRTVTNNAKNLYNDNGLGDYDSDVNSWMLVLGGSTYTSQINGRLNQWEGIYDNVHIMSVSSETPDLTPPVLTIPDNVMFEANGFVTNIPDNVLGNANVTDNYDPDPFVAKYMFAVNNAGTSPIYVHNASSFPLGTTIVSWYAIDAGGNISTKNQIVRVQDTISPVILAPVDIILNSTGSLTALTSDDYGTARAIDIVDPAPTVTSNAPLLFHVGNTTIIWTATDSSGNAVNATQTVTLTPAFKTIRDSFNNGTNWETYSMVSDYVPISGPDYTTFSNYAFTIEQQDGNPSPSARISGDGFTSYFAIQRNVTLSDLGENDLFVGIDYKATSATSASSVTNAKIELLDGDGSILYSNWLSRGGTVNTGWSTFSQNVTDAVAGSGIITIRLGLNDGWIANWSQNAYFDNLYVGTTPSTADQVSSPQEEMSPIQILSERIAQADDTELCRIASEGLPYSDDLISYYNRTATC